MKTKTLSDMDPFDETYTLSEAQAYVNGYNQAIKDAESEMGTSVDAVAWARYWGAA